MVKNRKKEDTGAADIGKNSQKEELSSVDVNNVKTDVKEENETSSESETKTGYSGNERREKTRRVKDRRKEIDEEITNDEIESMKKKNSDKDEEIASLKEEIANLKDQMLRRQADFENYKKRSARLYEDQKKFIIRDMALDVIMVNDDLLRAIEASPSVRENGTCDETHKSFVEGVSLISRQLEDALGKYGVVEIESENAPFDPNLHEAVEIESSSDVEKDTVTRVYQKGFKIDDLIVRSSRVKVAKPFAKNSNGENAGQAENGPGENPDS